jgi:hypothetical protein
VRDGPGLRHNKRKRQRKRKVNNKAHLLLDVGFTRAQKHDSDDLQHYVGRTEFRNPANLAVALYCGIGSNSLNALVNAFDRLHMVRG